MARIDTFLRIKTEIKQALELKGITMDSNLTMEKFAPTLQTKSFDGLVSGKHTRTDMINRFGTINIGV